jgi:integrase/recombinase XerD
MAKEIQVLPPTQPPKLDKSQTRPVPAWRGRAIGAEIPHLTREDVLRLAEAAERVGRGHKGKRDKLLILVLYDACLRVSEALGLRPQDIVQGPRGFRLRVHGKGNRWGEAAVSPSMVAQLYAYIAARGIKPGERIFPITRKRAHQIAQRAFEEAGVIKPEGTGHCHILRHSGALERLRLTRNPRALQEQLRHRTVEMTLRYFKTLTREEALQVQENVDLWATE